MRRKIINWFAILLLTPIVLFLLLAILLYIPPVQNWAVKQVASYASDKTGMDISVDNVHLAFPLDLKIEGFKMIQPNDSLPQVKDTVADVRKLIVDIQAMPLLKSKVEIDALEFTDTKVNTTNFIPSARIKGRLGRLYLQSHGIDISKESVRVNTAKIEQAQIDIALSDTVPPDTTESKADWKISIDKIDFSATDFTLHLPGDTMSIHTNMDKAVAKSAYLGLKDGIYKVGTLDWHGGELNYDMNYVAHSKGFDANHIAMTDIFLGVDSFVFDSPNINMYVRAMQCKEKSGLQIDNFKGHFAMDSKRISLPDITLKTPYTTLSADFRMDMNAFSDTNPGNLYAQIDGAIGFQDITKFAPGLPTSLTKNFPRYPIEIKGKAEGNLKYITFKNLNLNIPTSLRLFANGWMANPTDMERMRMDVKLKGHTGNLAFVTAMLPDDVRKTIRLPQGIDIDGRIKANRSAYTANLNAGEGGGTLRLIGTIDTKTMAYDVKAKASRLPLQHFLPNMGLSPFTGEIAMHGKGTDFLSPQTGLTLTADIRDFKYDRYQLGGIRSNVNLRNGKIYAKVDSRSNMFGGHFTVGGTFKRNNIDVTFKGNVTNADLKTLGIADKKYLVSTDADLHIKSNLSNYHYVNGHIGELSVRELRGKNDVIPLADGDFDIHGTMQRGVLAANFNGRIDRADLYQLGAFDTPLALSVCADVDIKSDLRSSYAVRGLIGDVTLDDNKRKYEAHDMALDILTRRDTTYAKINSGDFYLDFNAKDGYEKMGRQIQALSKNIGKQLDNKHLVLSELRKQLPDAHIALVSGDNNLLTTLLKHYGYTFNGANLEFTSSPSIGLNGKGYISSMSLLKDSVTLDSVYLALKSDTSRLNYDVRILNNRNNAYPFKGLLNGYLHEKGLRTNAKIVDANNKTGLDVGLLANVTERGVYLNLASATNIIGYKEFHVNDSNYIFMGKDHRVSANMRLHSDDGAGAYIYTDDSDMTALQNITLSMHRFELEKVFSVLPYMPRVSGVLDGDFHVVQTPEDLTVSSDLTVSKLVYEGNPMGDVGSQLVYMPLADGTHYVDAIITRDNIEIGTLNGTYDSKDDGNLDAKLTLARFPLNYINGFIPDQIVGLDGVGDGELTVNGPLGKLDINGEVYLDSCYLYSTPYGVRMRFANDPVRIQNSKLLFENFEMYANNDSPLNIQGALDFSDMENMNLDVRMKAENFLLIDAKETARSEVYGKAYVNYLGTMKGPFNRLTMLGKLDILGGTDMTYMLRESALTTDSQMDDLIKFTNFSDTIPETVKVRPDMGGFTMAMGIEIDEQAHIVCALNADHSNYIDLIGGGNLRMLFNSASDFQLFGRYTLSSGEMKYSLPVIPLHTFNIKDGSYIEFLGDPYNPTLNITATENLKANVADGSSSGKIVDFECGVSITQTMSKPWIEFIINTPEDMQMQNELNMKSKEERGKLAVSMLASGMYLGEGGGTTNSAMSGALASFMQSEINNITGSALRSMGLDLSANLETSTDAAGALHTDYTFKFSKQLLNNRLRIMMGGRVSTGSEAAGDNGAFFDNFSMEYRLNKNETQYLKLFYEREAYDWLEGNISQFGAGFMWKRKLEKLSDIFRFKKKAPAPPANEQKKDTLVTFINEKK